MGFPEKDKGSWGSQEGIMGISHVSDLSWV